MKPGRVRIFYPADPSGVVAGGIDTFIRGIIKWAPPELEFSLVGMSTDTVARPLGRWSTCLAGPKPYAFYPAVVAAAPGTRGRLPLSLRYAFGAWRHARAVRSDFDVFDFHRPEPSLLYLADARPKNAYFHQDPETISTTASDNLWRRLPAAYERIEARAVAELDSAWCVRETGVQTLRARYPALGNRVNFLPTWVDAEVFNPAPAPQREALRQTLGPSLGADPASRWIVFVGRLDTQKNPALLLESFARVRQGGANATLLLVGDGVLRKNLERQVQEAGIADRVRFLGLRPQAEIARLLQAADLFALSSAYEGMPMALLEALGCGTPVITTDVGEVKLVVQTGHNGVVVASHAAPDYAAALAQALDLAPHGRQAAVQAVARFQPAQVLAPVYARYVELAAASAVAPRVGARA
jgi:glycosyltransferase involved in cell wall biosynthesis